VLYLLLRVVAVCVCLGEFECALKFLSSRSEFVVGVFPRIFGKWYRGLEGEDANDFGAIFAVENFSRSPPEAKAQLTESLVLSS